MRGVIYNYPNSTRSGEKSLILLSESGYANGVPLVGAPTLGFFLFPDICLIWNKHT